MSRILEVVNEVTNKNGDVNAGWEGGTDAGAVIPATKVDARLAVVPVADLVKSHPQLKPPVIDGYLRRGETMNVIASPKVGKSWLTLGLAYAVQGGGKWLGAPCTKGRVLLVDNELHLETMADRMRCVGSALEEPSPDIDVLSLRGQSVDIIGLAERLDTIKAGKYAVIVLDALYRFLPAGTSENENAGMMMVYNTLDYIAKQTQAAVIVIHHASKGNQATKAQTDVGSGAGAISRAADTHMTIRPHEEAGYFVLEAVTRSFRAPDPTSIYFEFPRWEVSAIEPSIAPERKSAQVDRDAETKRVLLSVLKADRWTSKTKIREATGFGFDRIARGMRGLVESNTVATKRLKSKAHKGKAVDVYQLTADIDALTNLV